MSRYLLAIVMLVGCAKYVPPATQATPEPPILFAPSLSQIVDEANKHRFCHVAKYEDRNVDWVVKTLRIASTGSFYTIELDRWHVSVFLKGDDCCVPEVSVGQHRIQGVITNIGPGHITISDAEIEELH